MSEQKKNVRVWKYGFVIAVLLIVSISLFSIFKTQGSKSLKNSTNTQVAPSSNIQESDSIKPSRYPWCDTDDIVLPDGKQVWSACNVGASKASQYETCKDIKTACPEDIAGKSFRWGNNELYQSGSTILGSTGANAWGGINNDPKLVRGPCELWYHIPSIEEVKSAITITISEPYDPNNPWKKDRPFMPEFQDYLKMPNKAWYKPTHYTYWGEIVQNNTPTVYFWTRNLSEWWDHPPVKVELYNKSVNVEEELSNNKDALPIRCIKDKDLPK